MTKQHLPGPWLASRNYAGAIFIESARPVRLNTTTAGTPLVCEVYAHDDAEHFSGAANAQLIAAAPDLLKALQAVVCVADRATVEFDAARAAIALATGATHA